MNARPDSTRTDDEIRRIHRNGDLGHIRGQMNGLLRELDMLMEIVLEARETHPHVAWEKVQAVPGVCRRRLREVDRLITRIHEGR